MKNVLMIYLFVAVVTLFLGCSSVPPTRDFINESQTKFRRSNTKTNFNESKVSLLNIASNEFNIHQKSKIDSTFIAIVDTYNLNIELIKIDEISSEIIDDLKETLIFNKKIDSEIITYLLNKSNADFLQINYFTHYTPEVYSASVVNTYSSTPFYGVNGSVTYNTQVNSSAYTNYKNGMKSKILIYDKSATLNQIDLLQVSQISSTLNNNNCDYLDIYGLSFFQKYYLNPLLKEKFSNWNLSEKEYELFSKMFDKYFAIKYSLNYNTKAENFEIELSLEQYNTSKNLLTHLGKGWMCDLKGQGTVPIAHDKVKIESYTAILNIFPFDAFIGLNFKFKE